MMRILKPLTLLIITFTSISCSANKKVVSFKPSNPVNPTTAAVNNSNNPKNPNTPVAVYTKSNSTQQYINKYKQIAIEEMRRTGIPASITLAQGIFESSSGNSDLVIYANNHFGIKCTSDWQGESFNKDDDKPNECFRKYPHAEGSFRDHSEFLKRPRYAELFKLDPTDYKGWARGLKSGGYATNPQYAPKLIELIERYELYRFDNNSSKEPIVSADNRGKLFFEENPEKNQNTSKVTASIDDLLPEGQYRVKAGDTLYAIAKKFNLKVEDIVSMNNLESYSIEVGQLLKIAK